MIFDSLVRFVGDEDGVSPVIGEILMVAIVVLMAGIVAAFVFGVVSVPSLTPQASIVVDDVSFENEDCSITLLHKGGSSLDVDDTRVIVSDLDDGEVLFSMFLGDVDGVSGEWLVGERISFVCGENDFEGEVEVRVVDEPSGGTISVDVVMID
ncbi:type IV pilin N-terminal domain-containing protein [Methanonatronarchaeum sp. AMET-Sl]|uniref:type IV pilin N-terminal domain-containing protein n=1 Tax=Methanonatronarchaeum sp. AMET-Sl TaxID=3037654 RepID=UPI00244D9ACF|nr:type IV pilin N-terminal domain-containing protein [Methanonatronarchaeum sp. AMET-Sl]WGI17071.1 type IV pilin N-terminal domain-containing protein [Methanonatronarchaeum sp. AMET-Sl]